MYKNGQRVIEGFISVDANVINNHYATILHAGKLLVRDQSRQLNFINLSNTYGCTLALGFTRYLTEMSTRD
jgi:hypothetical protein